MRQTRSVTDKLGQPTRHELDIHLTPRYACPKGVTMLLITTRAQRMPRRDFAPAPTWRVGVARVITRRGAQVEPPEALHPILDALAPRFPEDTTIEQLEPSSTAIHPSALRALTTLAERVTPYPLTSRDAERFELSPNRHNQHWTTLETTWIDAWLVDTSPGAECVGGVQLLIEPLEEPDTLSWSHRGRMRAWQDAARDGFIEAMDHAEGPAPRLSVKISVLDLCEHPTSSRAAAFRAAGRIACGMLRRYAEIVSF